MQNILITGGAGYVGGRVVSALSSGNKYRVRIGTHRLPDALPSWTRNYEVVSMNVRSRKDLEEACAGMDAVVHLAALNEVECGNDPALALTVNTLGTLHTLEAAIATHVERFVYVSTAHVYGAPLAGHIDEDTPAFPVHPYAITHRAAEDFVRSAHRRHAITGVVLRLSNGFGAPADKLVSRWSLLVNDLCRQAVTEGRLVLRSAGLQQRDFVTLHDVGQGIKHLLEIPVPSIADGVFNLGGSNPMRVIDMVQLIADRCAEVLNRRPEISRPCGVEETLPLDYSIAKLEDTGFQLSGDAASEIDATLRVCQNTLQSEAS